MFRAISFKWLVDGVVLGTMVAGAVGRFVWRRAYRDVWLRPMAFAQKKSFIVSIVALLPPLFLRSLPKRALVLLFVSAMYRGNLDAGRAFFSAIERSRSLTFEQAQADEPHGFGWPRLDGIARNHALWARSTHHGESPRVAVPGFGYSHQQSFSAYERALFRGLWLHFQVLSGRQLIEPRHIVSLAPSFVDGAGDGVSLGALINVLERVHPGQVAVVPSYLLPFLNSKGSSRIWSFHTVGRGPNLIHFKVADVPPYLCVDEAGFSGWASLADRTLESLQIQSRPDDEIFMREWTGRYRASNLSKYEQAPLSNSPRLPDAFVFVAMQVASDLTQKLRRWPQWGMVLMVALRFAGTGVKTVVKRHPKCDSMAIRIILGCLSKLGLIRITQESIHELIPRSEAVFTVNSGVGSEALMYEKPVYLFGRADYQLATWRVGSVFDLWKMTKQFALPIEIETFRAFLRFYRAQYLVNTDDAAGFRLRVVELMD